MDKVSDDADERRSEDEWDDAAENEGVERDDADDGGPDAVADGKAILEEDDVVLERDEEYGDERECLCNTLTSPGRSAKWPCSCRRTR